MTKLNLTRRMMMTAAVAAMGFAAPALADGHKVADSIHFLIPGGAGGGWDGTARGTGEALMGAGLVGTASYENMSGGGGGKAIGYLIENAASQHGTLMVNSTPIVIRSLTGVFPHNFRDLTLVAGTIGDYAAIVVGKDSPINSMSDFIAAYKADMRGTAVGGGSVPGGMDHLVAAMVMKATSARARGSTRTRARSAITGSRVHPAVPDSESIAPGGRAASPWRPSPRNRASWRGQ